MRLRRNSLVVLTITDGTILRGRVRWSWRWRVIRLVDVTVWTEHGDVPAAGPVLVPHRSVVLAQEVTTDG